MKIQLDYDRKVVTLETNANLKTFFDRIQVILEDWAEWSLDTKTEIVWNKEVVYRDAPQRPLRPMYGMGNEIPCLKNPNKVDVHPMTMATSSDHEIDTLWPKANAGIVQLQLEDA